MRPKFGRRPMGTLRARQGMSGSERARVCAEYPKSVSRIAAFYVCRVGATPAKSGICSESVAASAEPGPQPGSGRFARGVPRP